MVKSYPALAVPEVLLAILEKLSSKDLFSMALACKDWIEPALETRWRTGRIKISRLLATSIPLDDKLYGDTKSVYVTKSSYGAKSVSLH